MSGCDGHANFVKSQKDAQATTDHCESPIARGAMRRGRNGAVRHSRPSTTLRINSAKQSLPNKGLLRRLQLLAMTSAGSHKFESRLLIFGLRRLDAAVSAREARKVPPTVVVVSYSAAVGGAFQKGERPLHHSLTNLRDMVLEPSPTSVH